MKSLIECGRGPRIIALENVVGTLTSHKGADFSAICVALENVGYRLGAVIVDASYFVPHSRPRLFVIAVSHEVEIPSRLIASTPAALWHPKALRAAQAALPESTRERWVWWNLPRPSERSVDFRSIIEDNPSDVNWHSAEETERLVGMMSGVNFAKLELAKSKKSLQVGAVYRRTRIDEDGFKVQRAEVRFDDLAGCLRTPAGGSSRQVVLIVEGSRVRSRLISGRETARLMGLPESYQLPTRYNEAYHLTGDGVVVPVVRHLATSVFEPLLFDSYASRDVAA